jgi:cysteinyl-tRNA synthetase
MAWKHLGETFDIHGGGIDLVFPHHENEIAQSRCSFSTDMMANYWMHNGFLQVEGEKMSKSLGNFTTLLDLVDTMDPRSYRLLLLQSHYRSPVSVNTDTVGAAERALGGLDTFARRAADAGVATVAADPALVATFRERMDDDLDTANAMALVFDAARRGNAAVDAGDLDLAATLATTVRELCAAVGLVLKTAHEVPSAVLATAAALDAARAAKDFAAADALRSELQADGWLVETTKTGTTVRR